MGTIGTLLCHRGFEAPLENVDRVELNDVRQEAALRLVRVFQSQGRSFGDDIAGAFNDQAGLATQAYQWAYRDALRRKLGRSRGGDAERSRPMIVSLSRGRPGMADGPASGHTIADTLVDQSQEAQLAAVDIDHAGEVRRLWEAGIDGLSLEQSRRVLALMTQTQDLKDRGVRRLPDRLRQQIHRLRRETGLPLQTALL